MCAVSAREPATKATAKKAASPAIAAAPKPALPPQWVAHPLPDGTPLTANAAILMDVASGRVLWEYNPHKRMYPASLTKMMTGLLTSESPDLERVCCASALAAKTGESSIALQPREPLKLRQVLQASLIKSANDATVMAAEAVDGSVPQFVQMMNNRAAAMGLRDTHFANPHGLHNPNHYSSAADLCTIARAGLQVPAFNQIVGTREAFIPWQGKSWMRKLVNRNRLLLAWPRCDGVKTGYTKYAGRCLAASATEGDWRLLCVVLKCKNSWLDARNVLQWGFRSFTHAPVATTDRLYRVRVHHGASRTVMARPERNLYVVLGAGETAPVAAASRAAAVAPIVAGQAVGTLVVGEGQQEQTVRLLATTAVPESLWGRLTDHKIPQILALLLVLAAAGVLAHGASSKAARARRRRIQARKRETDSRGQSHRQRKTG